MGYNVLSGSVSSVGVIQSGSFSGDGSGLENVEQFPLQNSAVSRIPFYKTIEGKTGLNANSNFSFDASSETLNVPTLVASSGITASVGLKILNPTSGSLAGMGSFIGLDSSGNLIVTSSVNHALGPDNSLQFHSSGGTMSGSGNLTFDGTILDLTGTMAITGSILPSGSGVFSLGSPDSRWDAVYLSSGSIHLGANCSISTDETTSHHSITFNKRLEVSGSGSVGEGLTLTGHMLPSQTNVYDLGSPDKQWRSLYVSSSTVYFGGESLSVANGSLRFGSGSASKGFHVGHLHLLNRGILMDQGFVFNVGAFQTKFNGGIAYMRITKTADYQMQEFDYLIGVLTGHPSVTGSLTMTLPAATACEAGQNFVIKDESGNANNHNIIVKTSNSDTIDGLSSIILKSPYSSVNIYTNGIGKFFIH